MKILKHNDLKIFEVDRARNILKACVVCGKEQHSDVFAHPTCWSKIPQAGRTYLNCIFIRRSNGWGAGQVIIDMKELYNEDLRT